MATNNYFGFGGAQYGTTGAAYQPGQTGYAVTPTAATAATYTAQRAGTAYETAYQTAATHTTPGTYAVGAATPAAATTYEYGYGRTPAAAAAAAAYDATKSYYQQPAATAAAYSTTESHFQAAKPAFSTSTYAATTRQVTQTTPKAAAYTTTYPAQVTQGANYSTTAYTVTPAAQTTSTTKPAAVAAAAAAAAANPSYSNYDAALYSATMYVAQQATGTTTGTATAAVTASTTANKTGTWQGYRRGGYSGSYFRRPQQKTPPKPQQLHYCDVCKISCAGPQTYREHLEGQRHKKKEQATKTGVTAVVGVRGGNALRCELCEVTCTGTDAYAAHIRGVKHQKVVKLHTKLGKPIPSNDPVVLGAKAAEAAAATKESSAATAGSLSSVPSSNSNNPEVKVENAKEDASVDPDLFGLNEKDIQPVGQDYIEEIKNEEGKLISFNCKLCECKFNDPNAKEMHMKGRRHRLQYKRKVNPDLVVDLKPSFKMRKLQDFRYNRRQDFRDEFWRRREEERMVEEEERFYWEERRRYEEEVEYFEWYRRYGRDPRGMPPPPPPRNFGGPPGNIPPLMPQIRRPESVDDKHVMARHAEIYPKEDELASVQKIVSHTEKALKLVSDFLADSANNAAKLAAAKPGATPATNLVGAASVNKSGSAPATKPVTSISPTPPSTAKIVTTPVTKPNSTPMKPNQSTTKPAQPQVTPAKGPQLSTPSPNQNQMKIKTEPGTTSVKKVENSDKKDEQPGKMFSFQQEKDGNQSQRILKGVMRVGVLAKGLLLHGDTAVNLVVLCAEKPTKTLLAKVAGNLIKQLLAVAPEEQYKVAHKLKEAALVVMSVKPPLITVTVTLTSPLMREPLVNAAGAGDSVNQAQASKDPPDVLDKQKCLDALAALRHAKWFQARATGLQSCVMIIRILRDLCQRVPTWTPLNSWPMELLVEKVISSAGQPLSPADALRRILEALASGILLPGGPGLLDPCEKDPCDAAGNMTPQQREDITSSAQHALRLTAFRQIHKVLGMDPLPPPKFNKNNRFNRKRRRDNSNGESNDSEAGDGKKDKKDDEKMEVQTVKSDPRK